MADTKTVAPKEGPGTQFWNWLTETQVWTSIFRHERPNTDRNRVLLMLSNVFLHLHPVRIRKSGVKLRYTWCMGGLSFFLFLSLTLTGLLLMFYYRPTLEYAYTDIVGLREHVPLGRPRDGHYCVAAHVPRVHDRIVQAAARVQLVGGRDHARPDLALVVHGLSAAVGSARNLGDHGRLKHGARNAVPRPRRAWRLVAPPR